MSGDGCYICQPDNPRADEEGCSDCERTFWRYVVAFEAARGVVGATTGGTNE